MGSIREPAVAGQFYPGQPSVLSSQIEDFLSHTRLRDQTLKLKALLVPHAGLIYSGQTAAWGYRQLDSFLGQTGSNSIHYVLLGPSHHVAFSNLAADNHRRWRTPLGLVTQKPSSSQPDLIQINNPSHQPEHCLEVQLPFLQTVHQKHKKTYTITCFLTGHSVDTFAVTKYLLTNYPNSIFIISSDLSHYLPLEFAHHIDTQTQQAITQLDTSYFKHQANTACGSQAIAILLNMAQTQEWQPKIIHYDTSATASGDTHQVVGYLSALFYETQN